MVRTEGPSTVEDGWREVFDRGRVVPPARHTVRRAAESHLARSEGFQLGLSRLTAPPLPQEASDGDQDVVHQLRATLFDRTQQHFFGNTWKSPPQRMKNNKLSLNEVVYFHTALRLPGIVLVLELVSLSWRPDGSQHALGRGFAVLELFTERPETDSSAQCRRVNLHHGSPRSLLHPGLKDSNYESVLKPIDGSHLDCVMKNHPPLLPMMHLLPENVLLSGRDNIPGLAVSPTGDSLLRPQTCRTFPVSLSRLTVRLHPSLENFESRLLQLVNADCHNTKHPGSEGPLRSVVIQEMRLHVGVHNGWCFLDKPQVAVLERRGPGAGGRWDGGRWDGDKQTTTQDSSVGPSLPQTLALRSSLELRLTNHHAVGVVFQLECVFSAPIGRDTMLSSTSSSRAAFLQTLRWGVWCPFQPPCDWRDEEVKVVLEGDSRPNPHGVVVYVGDTPAGTPSPDASAAVKDFVTFRVSSSPKTSLRTKPEDASRHTRSSSSSSSSPPRGRRSRPPASPPESPPGPGLSLSQLAETSRYPTVIHSGSALPWQQPFPSALHPSPSASAHQLSHVAYSGVSNIAHLEMDLQQEGGGAGGAGGGAEGGNLQELPFTPVHAPIINLEDNTVSSSSSVSSSRSSLALLHAAGFPDITDASGAPADLLDPTEPVTFDPQREEDDPLQGNLLLFQFLAFTRIPGAGVAPDWPDSVHFTFQFYRFPAVTTQRLRLEARDMTQQKNRDMTQQKNTDSLPCVLVDHNSGPGPGLQVQFRADEGFLRSGERRWFLRYLARHTLHIDVWDSESLLLIGSTAVQLKYLLRQGRSAVQALHEVQVLTTDYVGDDALLTATDSNQQPVTVQTIVRGRLHVRTGNIGFLVDDLKSRSLDATSFDSHIIRPQHVTTGFRGGRLSSRNVLRLNARNVSRRPERTGDGDAARRKLDCMAAVHQRERREEGKVTDGTEGARPIRDLPRSRANDELSKAEGIANMLSHAITTQHRLYASLGSAHFMEFVLKNPFNVPQTVTVHSDDPELSVITSTEEWEHFKVLTRTGTPLEENLFHLQDGEPRVYLRPNERIHVPLKFQSFTCDRSTAVQGPSFPPPGTRSQVANKNASNIVVAKTIKVSFRAEDGQPMAICQLMVEPTPHVVDQTFRLYHPELCFLKKAIRLSPWQRPADQDVRNQISVRCSDPDVVCQTRLLVEGEPQDVYLKVPGSPSPQIRLFFVMVYTDAWSSTPSQIWRIFVHFLQRVDVSCVSGQRSCQSLVLRGGATVRKVKGYCSHPLEVQLDPGGVFVLPPAAVQDLQLMVQSWRAGKRFLFVNVVDVEQRRLVSAWLLSLNVHRPVLSKAFEVCVPVGGGSSRRISYTNPYGGARCFLLRSDRPDLLQFKDDQFQVDGRGSYSIGLRFAPSRCPGSEQILVYVNDLQEKTEETFCVRVSYS